MAPTERTALLNGNYCQNGTHIIDIISDKTEYQEISNDYDSLSLDELLHYKNDPWWQNFRHAVFIAFWITLCLTFLSACGISYLHSGSCQLSKDTTMESTITSMTTL